MSSSSSLAPKSQKSSTPSHLESSVAAAQSHRRACKQVLEEAALLLTNAERALAAAQESVAASKGKKPDADDAVRAAEAEVAQCTEQHEHAETAFRIASDEFDTALDRLQREHARLTSEAMLSEGSGLRDAFVSDVAQACVGMRAALAEGRTRADDEARDLEQLEARLCASLRRKVDPSFRLDRRAAIDKQGRLPASAANTDPMLPGGPGGFVFPSAPPVSTFAYPVHSSALPRDQRLSGIAKFQWGQRAYLIDPNEAAGGGGAAMARPVRVTRVELGDVALPPNKFARSKTAGDDGGAPPGRHEAVYQVAESTAPSLRPEA